MVGELMVDGWESQGAALQLFRNPHSAIRNPQSKGLDSVGLPWIPLAWAASAAGACLRPSVRHSPFRIPHSAIRNPQSNGSDQVGLAWISLPWTGGELRFGLWLVDASPFAIRNAI